MPLTRPAYRNLPVEEGYLAGSGGVRLFYRVVGHAKHRIVFLHGGPGLGIDDGGYDLEPLAARGHTLVMLNERGGGRSELVDSSKLAIRYFVADLEALRKGFDLDRLDLIGLSWGSAIAVHYAVEHPERVNRIVFLSPMSPSKQLTDERRRHVDSLLSATARARLADLTHRWRAGPDSDLHTICSEYFELFLPLYVVDPAHLRRQRGDLCSYSPPSLRAFIQHGAYDALGDYDLLPLFAAVRTPALVIEGERTNVPLPATEAIAKALPNGRLFLVPEAGHMCWLDEPDAVVAAMDEFFRGRWPVGSHDH